jgi:hypothetical protein
MLYQNTAMIIRNDFLERIIRKSRYNCNILYKHFIPVATYWGEEYDQSIRGRASRRICGERVHDDRSGS